MGIVKKALGCIVVLNEGQRLRWLYIYVKDWLSYIQYLDLVVRA